MTDLSTLAQQEIQEGRAVLLETALKSILDSVEEVVSYTIDGAQPVDAKAHSGASVTFQCRLHDAMSVPLDQFCYMQGIVSNETVKSIILLLRAHTGETITFKR